MMREHGLKIFSVLVAVLLSVFVNSEGNTSVVAILVPVEIQNVPAGKMVLSQSATQVQVGIRGPSFLISRVALTPPIFRIRLPQQVESSFVATLSAIDLALPAYVQVLTIEPKEIEIEVDRVETKTVPIDVPQLGVFPDGLELERLEISPREVEISGPSREIGSIARIETTPLDLSQLTGSTEIDLPLRVAGRLTSASAQEVSVLVSVRASTIAVTHEGVPVQLRPTGAPGEMNPDRVAVELKGDRALVNAIKKGDIKPYVMLPSVSGAEGTFPVRVDLPSGLSLVRINPSEVRVTR